MVGVEMVGVEMVGVEMVGVEMEGVEMEGVVMEGEANRGAERELGKGDTGRVTGLESMNVHCQDMLCGEVLGERFKVFLVGDEREAMCRMKEGEGVNQEGT